MDQTSPRPAALSQAKAQFDQDGYAIFRNVLDPELVAESSQIGRAHV